MYVHYLPEKTLERKRWTPGDSDSSNVLTYDIIMKSNTRN